MELWLVISNLLVVIASLVVAVVTAMSGDNAIVKIVAMLTTGRTRREGGRHER